MQQTLPLVDLSFGLSQLSGNSELLHKMLHKFKAEFADSPTEVREHLANNRHHEAKMRVHTAKGITGNLGLTALFQCCKTLDAQIKHESVDADMVDEFERLMVATCSAISEQHFDSEVNANVEYIDGAKVQLETLLKRQEFIDDDLLNNLVGSLDMHDAAKAQFIEYVEKLQYDKAIDMLCAL
ncbi:Hpt domain-containing protein [Ningiella sp. W23]|uniref:Hpt domain-containing protein n=1 Tax=Ningiella sp. W23 TaxID=3023715 RepID=UPI0037564573